MENRIYLGGQGLLELDLKTGKELLNTNWTKKNHMFLQGLSVVYRDRVYGILSEQLVMEAEGREGCRVSRGIRVQEVSFCLPMPVILEGERAELDAMKEE